jgi:hypothetical protein
VFSEFGEIAEVRLPVDYDTGGLKGFGYVVFAQADGAPVRTGGTMILYGLRPAVQHTRYFD